MKLQNGFTLIEILLALFIFAILATITSQALYNTFNAREIIQDQAEQLNQIQLTISLIDQDSKQLVRRAIRTDNMQLYKPFIGRKDYIEYTRNGISNPFAKEKRSTLKRIALVCSKNKLLRRN